ncbi:hypothetical protein C8R46DRAFT_1081998 [Mycena filopes]|nr:hypothetical protein C8R46DRAFT_1081998 [Mycena filopes]
MPALQGAFSQVTSYRLGYTSQRPYPWRWATPAILAVFLMVSVFLTLLNIPLSAYEIVQESTYRPNDTLPPLLFSTLVPGLLKSPDITFSPRILTVGETIRANNSMFDFTIVGAWDENLFPVASFSYYNNPFSEGCDVVNITWTYTPSPDPRVGKIDTSLTFDVICLFPTLFRMTSEISTVLPVGNPPRELFTPLRSDLGFVIFGPLLELQMEWPSISIGVVPCCDCDNGSESSKPFTALATQVPCRTQPARLMRSSASLGDYGNLTGPPSTVLLSPDILSFTNLTQPGMNDALVNLFQSVYHLVRMELGIIVENQIFASPAMFNQTISPVYVSGAQPSFYQTANQTRASTSNATLMKQWADTVQFFNTTDRVPVISYLRPVPRMKPLGSAITSVFVSTFTMLSALWTIFSIVAGVLAARSEGRNAVSSIEDLNLAFNNTSTTVAQMNLSLARMQMALRKRGLFEEDDEDNELELSSSNTSASGHEEKSALLTHRMEAGTYSVV